MLTQAINVGIVDAHALFRKILKYYLSEQKNINVAFQASNMIDLFEKLENGATEVLLMDLVFPGSNGHEVLRRIREEYPAIKILVLSLSADYALINDLLDAGIYGYISKSDEPEELLQAIHTVSENSLYRNKLFTEALYWSRQNNIKHYSQSTIASLNDREKKIVQLIWEEKSNKEIADELFLGVRSVEKIRQDIKEKIGAKSTVGLIKYAINKKIIWD